MTLSYQRGLLALTRARDWHIGELAMRVAGMSQDTDNWTDEIPTPWKWKKFQDFLMTFRKSSLIAFIARSRNTTPQGVSGFMDRSVI